MIDNDNNNTAKVDTKKDKSLKKRLSQTAIKIIAKFYCQCAFTCSKLTLETPEQGSGEVKYVLLIVNSDHISLLVLVFLLLNLNI